MPSTEYQRRGVKAQFADVVSRVTLLMELRHGTAKPFATNGISMFPDVADAWKHKFTNPKGKLDEALCVKGAALIDEAVSLAERWDELPPETRAKRSQTGANAPVEA